jgi:hypothetical protein
MDEQKKGELPMYTLSTTLDFINSLYQGGIEVIYEYSVCSDGGLTMAGSDQLSNLTGEVKEVLKVVSEEFIDSPEYYKRLEALASQGWDDAGEIRAGNEIAEAILRKCGK